MEPRIIQRSAHTVSRKLISEQALKVLYRLRACNHIAYLAGGSVRDLLLGHRPKDFDVVTDAHPEEVRRIFRNCRLVGRRFRLAHVIFGRDVIEVATFRALTEPATAEPHAEAPKHDGQHHGALQTRDGMILRDNVFGTPEEDAMRRDFTVNALFYNIADYSVIDYVGGMEDLDKGLIRSIGPARRRYVEDPVRMIRAVRFASTLGLTIEPESYEAIGECRDCLALASRARLYEETLKLFSGRQTAEVYRYLRQTGLFEVMFPDFSLWLSAAGEEAEARTAAAFRQIDAWRRQGREPRSSLVFALIFGAYHEARAAELRRQGGCSVAGSLMAAVSEHMSRVVARIQVPKAVSMDMQHILGMQPRFADTRPKNRHRLASRQSFRDALGYFEFSSSLSGQDRELVDWWQQAEPEPRPGRSPACRQPHD